MANDEAAFIDRLLETNVIHEFKVWQILFLIVSVICTISLERIRVELVGETVEQIVPEPVLAADQETIIRLKPEDSCILHKRSSTMEEKLNNIDNESVVSGEKLLHREGSGLGTRLVTIVSALNVLRSRKSSAGTKSKQITV